MHPDAVVNERAGAHINEAGCSHREFHPRWGKRVEVSRIGKEGKPLVAWAGKPNFGLQGEFFHL